MKIKCFPAEKKFFAIKLLKHTKNVAFSIEFSQLKPCFLLVTRLFYTICAKTRKERVFKQKSSYCTCFAISAQNLLNMKIKFSPAEKKFFAINLVKRTKNLAFSSEFKFRILYHITPYLKDLCKNTDFT